MASKFKQGQNGLLIDPSNERVVGAIDRNGNELLFPYILAQSAVPIILLPAGTWNNTTGDMTLGTALPYQPTGTVLVYLFASGIAQGGLYQATFSANNRLQLVGNPTTVAGAYTPTTNQEVTLASATLPGGSMGSNGAVRKSTIWTIPGTATIKVLRSYFGAALFGEGNSISGASTIAGFQNMIRNRGDVARQINMLYGSDLSNGQAVQWQTNAVNTANDVVLRLVGNLQNGATDYIILEGYTIEVLPGA